MKYNIKMNFKWWEDVDWIYVAQDVNQVWDYESSIERLGSKRSGKQLLASEGGHRAVRFV